ncbi:hypothetical protein, partial [Akkermansia sp.]|uniref:hypothetical protein n=1 Tax=Akkermansia sp. TaxID=1872421 RepID=UPI003A835D0F
ISSLIRVCFVLLSFALLEKKIKPDLESGRFLYGNKPILSSVCFSISRFRAAVNLPGFTDKCNLLGVKELSSLLQ